MEQDQWEYSKMRSQARWLVLFLFSCLLAKACSPLEGLAPDFSFHSLMRATGTTTTAITISWWRKVTGGAIARPVEGIGQVWLAKRAMIFKAITKGN